MPEQHNGLPVAGYRPQSQANIDLVNENKRVEESILRALDFIASTGLADPRWLAIGRSHLEQGFMAINRAIFKPDRAKLEDDPE